MDEDVMLTTVDNPFNPFQQYESWWRYDHDHKYNTNEYLARVVGLNLSNEDMLNEDMLNEATDNAIDQIMANDADGLYAIVRKGDKCPLAPDIYRNNN
jgi:hypothetical protein